jgi:50S ribosomal protein L16 3-hydroxylase
MSYSIGFRSPKEQELLSNFADYVLAHDIGDVHLHNPEQSTQNNNGELLSQDLTKLTDMLKAALNSEKDIQAFMGAMLSQSRHQLDIVEPEEEQHSVEVSEYLRSGGVLRKVSGLRALYHQGRLETIYINGETFDVPNAKLAQALCDQDAVAIDYCDSSELNESIALLTKLINKGYWYFD